MALVMVYKTPSATPTFTEGATISGTLEAANVLTCAYTVTGSNGEVVRWYRHTADDGSDPSGTLIGEGLTYLLTSNENGFHIRVIVTATNAAGSETSTSAYTGQVTAPPPPEPPSFTSPVTISGTATVGSKLTVQYTPRNWDDVAITWTSYTTEDKQEPVALGTGPEYTLTLAEAERWIGVRVVLENAIGQVEDEDIVPMDGVDPYRPIPPEQYTPPAFDVTGMNVINVPAGANLQAAFNAARPGDVLSIDYTGVWTVDGKLTFPSQYADGSDWIYVVSSDLLEATPNLPQEGTRVTAADAAYMPTIKVKTYTDSNGNQQSEGSRNNHATVTIQSGASKVRFAGLNITTDYTAHNNIEYRIFPVGTGVTWSGYPGRPGVVGEEVVIDRCYVHGTETGKNRDGLVLYQGIRRVAIKDCRFDYFKGVSTESHAVHVYTSPGPTLIHNNTIIGAGIALFLCDSGDTKPVSHLPADITITKNYIGARYEWDPSSPTYIGVKYLHKNALESKGSKRVLVQGNVFHHSWGDGSQTGAPWFCQNVSGDGVWDVDFNNNLCIDTGGISLANPFDGGRGFGFQRMRFYNNLFINKAVPRPATPAVRYASLGGSAGFGRYVMVLNNTFIYLNGRIPQGVVFFVSSTPTGLEHQKFINNIFRQGNWSIGVGASGMGSGRPTAAAHITDFDFNKNVSVGSSASQYTTTYDDWRNWKSGSTGGIWSNSDVGYVNTAFTEIGHFALAPTSQFKGNGVGNVDIGVDVPQLQAYINASDIPDLS